MSRRDDIKKLLINFNRRLQALQERKALYGLETPIAILTEIEDITVEIETLQVELDALPQTPEDTKVMPPTDDAPSGRIGLWDGVDNQPKPDRSVWDALESQLTKNLQNEQVSFTDAPEQPLAPPKAARQARLFISHQHTVEQDAKLASFLHGFLTAQGFDVFLNRAENTEQAWLETVDREIKQRDFLIVLLSAETADNEIIQAEIRRAHEYRKQQGRPLTLPVRVAYEGLLPYSIDAFLNPLQYALWRTEADNERVGRDILAAIEGKLPQQPLIPTRPTSDVIVVSEDGNLVSDSDDQTISPPLPKFDPRLIEALEAPGGTVRIRDKFYVEREADDRLKREIIKAGSTTTIRAPHQTGKSSLLVRAVKHARENGAKIVSLDFQRIDLDHLTVPDLFLRYLAELIVRSLRLDLAEVERGWQGSLGPQDKLTYLMEDYILPEAGASIVLAMDEVDRLLRTHFYNDFFGMLRSWHNNRAMDEIWDELNLVMAISTEPYHLIADTNQSPFNVGLKLYLEDFDETQVRDLNERHGAPVRDGDFRSFFELLNGHPYLTRKALYTLIVKGWDWPTLLNTAARNDGPFSDHLRRHAGELRDETGLRQALKEVIQTNRCSDEHARFGLMRAGLIRSCGDETYTCRCDLYRIYFENKL